MFYDYSILEQIFSTCNYYRHKHLLWRKTIKKLKLICLLKSVDPGNN